MINNAESPDYNRPSRVVRRQHVPVLSLVALSGAALCFVGCASSTAVDANAQKKYGTEMAAKGFWREALFRYELAAKQAPGDAEVQNNLAVAYESLGETARALAHYRKALEISPENEKIKRNYARFAEYYTAVQRAAGATGPALSPAVPGAPGAAPASPSPTPTPTPTAPPR